jgi:hypothetical protein
MKKDVVAESLNNNSIYTSFKNAIKEYEQNGRSAKFKRMETKIIEKNNPILIYWFARYVKGADIASLQKAIMDNAEMKYWFFFAKYVEGADLQAFYNNAKEHGNLFWAKRFAAIILESSEVEGIAFEKVKEILADSKFKDSEKDINDLIFAASKEIEHSKGKRTEKFRKCEAAAFYSAEGINALMFAQHLNPYVNINELEISVMLRGDIDDMLIVAQNIKGSNNANMLLGVQMARLQYIHLEEDFNNRQELQNDAYSTENGYNNAINAQKQLNDLLRRSEELINVDNCALRIMALK